MSVLKKYLKRGLVGVSIAAFITAALLFISIKLDERVLDQAIAGQIHSRPNTGAFVEELNQWVYNNKGFRKNNQGFLFTRLGPTPVQVLESGGDCSDKSRLLSALLKRNGMESTLVMLHACEGCEATHTVVEANYEGGKMVADPVFNLVFPATNKKYFGINDLAQNPALLESRLDELTNMSGPNGKIAHYARATESYSWPKTINWEKYSALGAIAALIKKAGYDPHLMMRPQFLEDPKLFLFYLSVLMGIASACLTLIVSKLTDKEVST